MYDRQALFWQRFGVLTTHVIRTYNRRKSQTKPLIYKPFFLYNFNVFDQEIARMFDSFNRYVVSLFL